MPDDTYPRSSRANFPFNRGQAAPEREQQQQNEASDPLAELARLIGQNDPFAEATLSRPERDLRDILSGRVNGEEWSADERDAEGQAGDIALDAGDTASAVEPAPVVDRSFAGERAASYARSAPPVVPQDRDEETVDSDGREAADEYAQASAAGYGEAEAGYAASDYRRAPDGPYYGDNGELSEHDPYAQEDDAEEAPPRRRRSGIVAAVAVFGLAVIGTAGAYAYRTVFSHMGASVPPLIKADTTPNKIVPATQGGEGGKQIYDRIGDGSQGEKVVPREEQPLDINRSQAARSGMPASALTANGWPLPPGSPGAQNVAPSPTAVMTQPQSAPPAMQNAAEPRKVKTVTIRADQAGAPVAAHSAPAASDTGTVTASAPARSQPPRPAAPVPTAATGGGGPLALTPQNEAQEQPAAAPARTASLTSRGAGAASGGYVVQLSAQKTQEEASASFRAMQAKYPSVLSGRQLLIRKKEVAGKGTFYGAQVGPFASRDGAVQLCEQLKSAGGNCMVQKN